MENLGRKEIVVGSITILLKLYCKIHVFCSLCMNKIFKKETLTQPYVTSMFLIFSLAICSKRLYLLCIHLKTERQNEMK